MMYLENIKVDEFFKTENADRFKIFFNTLKPKNSFRGVAMDESELTYSNVLFLKDALANPTIENYFKIYEICFNQTPESFLKGTILDFIQSNRYIINFMKQLVHREGQLLEGESDAKWIAAGGEQMSVFGGKAVLIQIAEQFGKSPREIGEWKYNEVLLVQYYNHKLNEIMKLYNKVT